MSHDITAYYFKNKIFHINRAGFGNLLRNVIYDALDCNEFNAGVSGNGNSRWFKKQEIVDGLEYLNSNNSNIYVSWVVANWNNGSKYNKKQIFNKEYKLLNKILSYMGKHKILEVEIYFG